MRKSSGFAGVTWSRAYLLWSILPILGVPAPSHAGDLVLGAGVDNIDTDLGSNAATFQIEYHSDPLVSLLNADLAAFGVFETDDDEDVYLGAGVSAIWALRQDWFVEASLAAGYYDSADDGVDLGGNLQFRSLFGLGYRFNARDSISLAIDHLSNAGLEDTNPGRNAVLIRYRRSF